jgi:large subunit ribosomal protein L23
MKNNILLNPLFTEKVSILEERHNKYAFIVSRFSNKIEIKRAVEDKFDVKVQKVGIINRIGKEKQMSVRSNGRTIRTIGRKSRSKKAIITLHKNYKIDFLANESKDT